MTKYNICRIETTEHWNKEFLERMKITKIWSVYLYNPNQIFVYCSAYPKYYSCVEIAESCYESSKNLSDEEQDELYTAIIQELDNPLVVTSQIDNLSEEYNCYLGEFETENDAIEYYQGNPKW